MVRLRDVVEKDLDLFFNTDELAESVIINDKPYDVIIKSNALKSLKAKMGEGLFRAEVLFSVKKLDLPGKPKVKARMNFNNASYEIMSCTDEGHTYEVLLGANQ